MRSASRPPVGRAILASLLSALVAVLACAAPATARSGSEAALAPLELVLAVDASVYLRRWPVHEAAGVLLDSLHPDSCVVLLTFRQGAIEAVRGGPSDPALRARAEDLDYQFFRGGGAVAEGLITAVDMVTDGVAVYGTAPGDVPVRGTCDPRADGGADEAPPRRRALAAFLYNRSIPEDDEGLMEELTATVQGAGVPVFALVEYYPHSAGTLEVRGRSSPYPELRAWEALIEPTGGAVFRALHDSEDNFKTIWDALQEMIGALRTFASAHGARDGAQP